jgi:hypothetical protein
MLKAVKNRRITVEMSSFVRTFVDSYPVPVLQEMLRIFPDGLVITTGIYALLTLSLPFGIMFVSLLEATFFFHLLRVGSSYLGFFPESVSKASYHHICRTGFADPVNNTLPSLSMFTSILDTSSLLHQFPSSSIYMFSVASSYLFTTLSYQSKDLEALGPGFAIRYYISLMCLSFLLFIIIAFRVTYSCETFAVAILTVPIGLFIGMLLVKQNMNFFGPSGINLMGIPQLSSKTINGQSIYLCPKV